MITLSIRYVNNHLLRALVPLVLIVIGSSLFLMDTLNTSRVSQVSQKLKYERMFATKTKYWDQRNANKDDVLSTLPAIANLTDRVPLRSELILVQTQIVARHGIRYPTGENIREMELLLRRLKPFENLLPTWMQNFTLPYNLSVEGKLAEAGERELRDLGARSLARNGHERPQMYSKKKYRVAHTYVTRTRDSAIAFASSFFANAEVVEYIEYPQNKVLVLTNPFVDSIDVLLRFFDQCARYQREVKTNQTAQEQRYMYQRSSVMTNNAQWLKKSLGLKNEKVVFSAEDVKSVQSACAFDIALYHHEHHWCALLSETLVHSLDYLDDIEQFYWIGGGYKINYEMSAVLLREIFATMEAKVRGDSAFLGSFFFAHAETTLPLMTLLGYGDRSLLLSNATDVEIASRGFRTSILSPFAANLEFRLFKTKPTSQFFVQILVNEKEIPIPGCGRVFCKLSKLQHLWRYYLKTYDFRADCLLSTKVHSNVASHKFGFGSFVTPYAEHQLLARVNTSQFDFVSSTTTVDNSIS
ncbi:hypothetical protein DD237_000133 [Peronospora effusa]|uniref:Multiple inositol polyphosphate phosphatase 1 n=1 Tax=Peronospora effusa TaxID=542832 RepID=A0A3R7YE20_9STRA|nr:hypothetical protein DD237_000133 [Peronospora effusa]